MAMGKQINPIPRFVQNYEGRIVDWIDELCKSSGTIVAISRKGPRLLELLHYIGMLPSNFLGRVVSERALSFMNKPVGNLIVVDDHVCWGSTFSRIYSQALETLKRWGCDTEISGMPLAESENASEAVRKNVTKSFLHLDPSEVSSFVANETSAFHLLGKPYDIEHPIVYFTGDFSDATIIRSICESVSRQLFGEIYELDHNISTSNGNLSEKIWSIIFDPCKQKGAMQPEFSKLRIYLSPSYDRIAIVGMQPVPIDQSSISMLNGFFISPLDTLWNKVYETTSTSDSSEDRISIAFRSLVMWANYLNALPLLNYAKDILMSSFNDFSLRVSFISPTEYDLQLLIGPDLSNWAKSLLNEYFSHSIESLIENGLCLQVKAGRYSDERIPEEYRASYDSEFSNFIQKSQSYDDAVQAIFYAQHRGIELASRITSSLDHNRLNFGVSFDRLADIVRSEFPNTPLTDIHKTLDRLIDYGCVVPRYLDIQRDNKTTWVRAFRVGEGPLPRLQQTVKLLFETLSHEFATTALPKLLFEKYCVLALSVISDNRRLSILRQLGITRKFSLYGARASFNNGKDGQFLLDWALNQGILSAEGQDRSSDEKNGKYKLNNLEQTYPSSECPWDDEVRDALEDVSAFFSIIYREKGYKAKPFVLLSSLISNKDFHRSVEAELDLWLHDRSSSIYHGIQSLGSIKARIVNGQFDKNDFEVCNLILSKLANFTAQTIYKRSLIEEKETIYSNISQLVSGDTVGRRVWRDLSRTIKSRERAEKHTSGLDQILSTLRICYSTNRVLRDLLSQAGYQDPQGRAKPVKESVSLLIKTFSDSSKVDHVTRAAFASKDGQDDIVHQLENLSSQLPLEFSQIFDEIRPILFNIAERCEQLLKNYGTEDFNEIPLTLEPPQYVLMWDVKGSSMVGKRETEIDPFVERANTRIAGTLGDRIKDFRPESWDDGNGLICTKFNDVITVVKILKDALHEKNFRAGVEVNMQGRLNYYKESKVLGGRAFEHAARICDFFKEIRSDRSRWDAEDEPEEPSGSYLIIGEFCRRFAEMEGSFPGGDPELHLLNGNYVARVNASIPIKICLLKL